MHAHVLGVHVHAHVLYMHLCTYVMSYRAVCRNFSKGGGGGGGQIWGMDKRGGEEAYVRCYTLQP